PTTGAPAPLVSKEPAIVTGKNRPLGKEWGWFCGLGWNRRLGLAWAGRVAVESNARPSRGTTSPTKRRARRVASTRRGVGVILAPSFESRGRSAARIVLFGAPHDTEGPASWAGRGDFSHALSDLRPDRLDCQRDRVRNVGPGRLDGFRRRRVARIPGAGR